MNQFFLVCICITTALFLCHIRVALLIHFLSSCSVHMLSGFLFWRIYNIRDLLKMNSYPDNNIDEHKVITFHPKLPILSAERKPVVNCSFFKVANLPKSLNVIWLMCSIDLLLRLKLWSSSSPVTSLLLLLKTGNLCSWLSHSYSILLHWNDVVITRVKAVLAMKNQSNSEHQRTYNFDTPTQVDNFKLSIRCRQLDIISGHMTAWWEFQKHFSSSVIGLYCDVRRNMWLTFGCQVDLRLFTCSL